MKTLIDEFAIAALIGMGLKNCQPDSSDMHMTPDDYRARSAYSIADAMMKEHLKRIKE